MKNKNHTLRRLLKEFQFEQLTREPYRDGELVLEYVEGYEVPRYIIFFESGDLEEGNTDGEIIAELDSRFFDAQMSQTILEYITTR
jgi:hypothetical protein